MGTRRFDIRGVWSAMDVLGLSDYSAPKLSVSREWTKHDEKVSQASKMAHDHRRMLGSDLER